MLYSTVDPLHARKKKRRASCMVLLFVNCENIAKLSRATSRHETLGVGTARLTLLGAGYVKEEERRVQRMSGLFADRGTLRQGGSHAIRKAVNIQTAEEVAAKVHSDKSSYQKELGLLR